MSQQQDSKNRAARLVELVVSASQQRLRPFSTWARFVDAAVGGEGPLAVAADVDDAQGGAQLQASGTLIVVTASFVARVTFTDLAYAMGGGRDDGPFEVTVHPRSAITTATLRVPGISRQDRWAEDRQGADGALPWGTTLDVHIDGDDAPVSVGEAWCTLPLHELHALLLDSMRRPLA